MSALRIGHLSTFYHTSLLMSASNGLDSSSGIDATWELFGTGPDIVNALEKGRLDIGYIGLPPAIIGVERGVPVKCIAGGHTDGTVFIGRKGSNLYNGRNNISDILVQFKGETIGVPGSGSIHDVIARFLLDKYKLTNEIELMNFRWADEIVEQLSKGSIAAAFGTPALAVSSERFAGASMLCPPEILWPNNPSYGIFVNESLIGVEDKLINAFLMAHEKTNEQIRTNPVDTAGKIAEVVGMVDSDFVLDVLKISPRYCAQLSNSFIETTMDFVNAMVTLGYLKTPVKRESIFFSDYITDIHPAGDHYSSGINL